MTETAYLIFHKDHPLHVSGVNSGAEMATLMLAKFLAKQGKRVIVCAQLPDGECKHWGVEFWDLGPEFDVQQALRRARSLGQYHLISACRALPLMSSKGESSCRSRSLISHDRSGNDTGMHPAVVSRVADNVICVSQAQREVLLAAGMDPNKSHVIYNGVDLETFTVGSADQRDLMKLVFVGALVEDKGIHVLVQSFADLKKKYPALTLDVYGSSSLWGRRKIFDESDIERQLPGIKFHGNAKQAIVAEAFRKCAACVVPSIWFDPFPLTSLEAQVSGCPVVAFDVGGLKEGMVDGETGVLISEISQNALTVALDKLLSEPQLLKKMSQRAAVVAPQRYNWQRVADQICSLCEKSASQRTVRVEAATMLKQGKMGFLSTWNQECGLATYAGYLLQQFEPGSYLVLAEDVPLAARKKPDQPYVERCWNRKSENFSALDQAIRKHGIGLLHLNFHDHNFIAQAGFHAFLSNLRSNGVKIVTHLHTTYTLDQRCADFIKLVDQVVVHSAENRLQVIANGVDPQKVVILPHGVVYKERLDASAKQALRQKYQIAGNEKLIVSFGFVQPNKGMEGVIEAVSRLTQAGIAARGIIAGKPNPGHPGSNDYVQQLNALATWAGITDRISFTNSFLSDEQVNDYLSMADLVFMNYQSQYYEASGACSLAVGCGALVVTSLAPAFAAFGDAVWRITSGFPAGISAEVLLRDNVLREEILKNAREYSLKNSWPQIKLQLEQIYAKLGFAAAAPQQEMPTVSASSRQGPLTGADASRSAWGAALLGEPKSFAASYDEIDQRLDQLEEMKRHNEFEDVREGCCKILASADANQAQRERATLLKAELDALEGNYATAQEAYQEVLRTNPRSVRALCGKGVLTATNSGFDEARKFFSEAHAIKPDYDVALSGLGLCAQVMNEPDKAWQYYLQALAANPENSRALLGLIELGYSLKRYGEVEAALQNYIEMHPADLNFLYSLAGCYYAQEKLSDASQVVDKILLFDAQHKNASELRRLIEEKR